jgi:hypothetical protein
MNTIVKWREGPVRDPRLIIAILIGLASLCCWSSDLCTKANGDPTPGSSKACQQDTWPTLTLDVGGMRDDATTAGAFLYREAGVSGRIKESVGGTMRWFRTVSEGQTLRFSVDPRWGPERLELDPMGFLCNNSRVIIAITYKDVVDETGCPGSDSIRAGCRPQLVTLLEWGAWPYSVSYKQLGAFAGLNDKNWKTARFFLDSTEFQPLQAIKDPGAKRNCFRFEIQFPVQGRPGIPLPIDEVTLRFVKEKTVFDAEREADRSARDLVRREVLPQEPPPSGGDPEDFAVFIHNYLEKAYPTRVPTQSEITDNLKVFELPGQREPVTFSIYAFRHLQGIRVRGTDLRLQGSGRDDIIPEENITINLVVPTDKRWAYGLDAYYGLQPWYLADCEPFDVTAGQSQQVWITIRVPDNAAAGTYTGTLTLSGDNIKSRSLPLTVTVFDVALQEADASPHLFWSPYTRSANKYANNPDTASRDMVVHNMDCPVVTTSATINLEDYSITFWEGQDGEFKRLAEHGLLCPHPYMSIGDNRDELWRAMCKDDHGTALPLYSGECERFDEAYKTVLRHYMDFFSQYRVDPDDPNSPSIEPSLIFVDEPAKDPTKRCTANRLNRLAQKVGFRTWVTYCPACEEPLAGYRFSFSEPAGNMQVTPPPWSPDDPHLMAYWDFDHIDPAGPVPDRSGHGNLGRLSPDGHCKASDGILACDRSQEGYMCVKSNPSLDLTTAGTICFWFRPEAFSRTFAQALITKLTNTADANYVCYFGGASPEHPEHEGWMEFSASIDQQYVPASGGLRLPRLGEWYSVVWVYDAAVGGTMYVNGVPFSMERQGPLAVNTAELAVGRLQGQMDEIAILSRAATDGEISQLITTATGPGYDRNQQIALTLTLGADVEVQPTMTFSLGDNVKTPAGLETSKMLEVNGITVWPREGTSQPEHGYRLYTAELASALRPGQENVIRWVFVNGCARLEELKLYFIDDFWRKEVWQVSTASPHWKADAFVADPTGDLGPMDPWLDERCYTLEFMNQDEIARTAQAGKSLSFYLPYVTTQPVPVNNRFLYGLYAAALGVKDVMVYAYGDWGTDAWDDCGPTPQYRSVGAARRGHGGYELIMPSWQDRVYDTIIYEALREGVEDSRIIATLKKEIAEHPGPGATIAQDYLNGILSRPVRKFVPRYMHTYPACADPAHSDIEHYANRSAEMLTDLAGSPDAYGVFDEIRLRMIRHILLLKGRGRDCNGNGVPDEYDIAEGTSQDRNTNEVPDECEPSADS